jgi:hypothetical protein
MNLCFPGAYEDYGQGYDNDQCSNPQDARLGHWNASNEFDFCTYAFVTEDSRTWEAKFRIGSECKLNWSYTVHCEWDEYLGVGPAICSYHESACDYATSGDYGVGWFTKSRIDYQTVEVVTRQVSPAPYSYCGDETTTSDESDIETIVLSSGSATIPTFTLPAATHSTATPTITPPMTSITAGALASSTATISGTSSANGTATSTAKSKCMAAPPMLRSGDMTALVYGLMMYLFGL